MLDQIAICVACNGSGKRSDGSACFPCKGNGRNPDGLRPSLAPFQAAFGDRREQLAQAESAFEQLQRITIETDEQYTQVGQWLVWIKSTAKEYETKRKAITKPLADAKREVDSWFKPVVNAWGRAEQTLKGKIQEYQAKQMAARQAIAQQMQASRGDVPTTMALAAQAQTTVTPDLPNVSERKIQRWRITNEMLIPREYWQINDAAVTAAMRAGQTIPGIEYYTESTLAVRG